MRFSISIILTSCLLTSTLYSDIKRDGLTYGIIKSPIYNDRALGLSIRCIED